MGNSSHSVGELSTNEAWRALGSESKAQLIDVRTRAEWSFVGIPELSGVGKQVILIEWQSFPDMNINDGFAAALRGELDKRGADASAPLYFICRSGARSMAAAQLMANQGYSACFNVAAGFEGRPDGSRHRGTVDGWKAEGLPWVQS